MRKLSLVLACAACALLPAVARAGAGVAVSVGSGYELEPRTRQATNLMLAPGYSVSWLRAELGLLGLLGDVREGRVDLQLRPMLVLKPSFSPLYLRGIVAATNLLERPLAYGGALGLSIGAGPLALFVEGGAMTRRLDRASVREARNWTAEGRAGLALGF